MKLKFKKNTNPRVINRVKKKIRIRAKVNGSEERPRLCVFRSLNHFYAQIVDDSKGVILASVSSINKNFDKKASKYIAEYVGEEMAKVAISKNIQNVVFDRNGYVFHGRVKCFAEAARKTGLKF